MILTVVPLISRGQTNSLVTIDSNNVVVLNGKKTFVIGLYPGPPTQGITPSGGDALDEIRSAGAQFFRISADRAWSPEVYATQQAALDWAAQHDMYCLLNLRELSFFDISDTNAAALLRNAVDTFRNHPALGMWKNYDEAWWHGVSDSQLQNGYNIIKQEDINHPVSQTFAPRGTISELQPYTNACDVLALDIFPVQASGSVSSPPISNTGISQVGDWTKALAQIAGPNRHFGIIEQIAASGTTPPAHTLVFPSFTQSRFMAYQAIVNGARSLAFFGGDIQTTLNSQDYIYGWNWTFWYSNVKPIVQEIGDHSLLADALVAPVSTLPITMSGTTAPDIEFCVREVPPYLYILATKREGNTATITFNGLPSWAGSGDVLYESPRVVTAQNGHFTDTFAPLDVHVYRFVQSNLPPAIVSNPQSSTNSSGSTATFTILINGNGPFTFQWLKSETNLTDGGNVSGSTNLTLTLSGLSSTDNGNYSVVVTSDYGSITSAPAILTVLSDETATILSQPQSLTNNANTTATFSVTAEGFQPLAYQWFKGAVSMSDGGNISGSQTPVLTLSAVSANDVGNYRVVVNNFYGSQTSLVASLKIIFPPPPYYEPFDYIPGTSLDAQINPGSSLTWVDIATGAAITNVAGNLSYPGLAPSMGNSVRFGGIGQDARFSFASPITNGTVYFSLILAVTNIAGLNANGVFFAGFNNASGFQSTHPTVVGTRIYSRAVTGGFNLGVDKTSSTTTDWAWDPRVFKTNQVLFIVGSYTFNQVSGTDDVSKMWINPDPSTFGLSNEPATTLISSPGTDLPQVASFLLMQRNANEPLAMLVDELRLGTSWGDVTPPVPVSPVLVETTYSGDGGFQFGFTNLSAQTFTVYSSTNLIDWSAIGVPLPTTPNFYQFTDLGVTNSENRFYQLRSP